jgi:hypothetical protein
MKGELDRLWTDFDKMERPGRNSEQIENTPTINLATDVQHKFTKAVDEADMPADTTTAIMAWVPHLCTHKQTRTAIFHVLLSNIYRQTVT